MKKSNDLSNNNQLFNAKKPVIYKTYKLEFILTVTATFLKFCEMSTGLKAYV